MMTPDAVQKELITECGMKSTTKPKRKMPSAKLIKPTSKAS